MLPRFHVLKHGFKAMLWVMVLGSRRPSLMAIQPLPPVQKLERIIKQLDILREVWPRIGSGSCRLALGIVAKDVVDLAEELHSSKAPAPGFTRNEKALLKLGLGVIAAIALFLGGAHLGRNDCPAPNVARVGP